MAVESSFLVLKAVSTFQEAHDAARLQAVCKSWCWGMRERVASLASDAICSAAGGSLFQALASGLCSPETLVLDIVGRHDKEVPAKELEALESCMEGLQQQSWFRRLVLLQKRVSIGAGASRYTRNAGYCTSWHMDQAMPLAERSLQALPQQLQVLELHLECLPAAATLAALAACPSLHTLTVDCQQGTLTLPAAEALAPLAASLRSLAVSLPELQLPAAEALVGSMTGLAALKLERKARSVCACVLRALGALGALHELRLGGFTVSSVAGLRDMLPGLTVLELSHAGMATQGDWDGVAALTELQELHLLPAPEFVEERQQAICTTQLSLPHVTSLTVRLHHPASLRNVLGAAPLLRTLHLVMPGLQEHAAASLAPAFRRLHPALRALTLDGRHFTLDDTVLGVLCSVLPDLTRLVCLGRVGPLGPQGLRPLGACMTGLKHLALGGRHMEQMFVVDVEQELPRSLEVLELCTACLVQSAPPAAPHPAPAGCGPEPAGGLLAGRPPAAWPHLRTLLLRKCCGVAAGAAGPDSTMLQPVRLAMHAAAALASVTLLDCTLDDASLAGVLGGRAVSSLTLAPYENWRGTAARLSAAGLREVLWSPAAAGLQQLELRLTHRMHRDGTDAELVTQVLPGMAAGLRALRLYTEESHWHRLPPLGPLGRLRKLQQLHLGAVHERRAAGVAAALGSVLPQHCRLTVVKYMPDLTEEP